MTEYLEKTITSEMIKRNINNIGTDDRTFNTSIYNL